MFCLVTPDTQKIMDIFGSLIRFDDTVEMGEVKSFKDRDTAIAWLAAMKILFGTLEVKRFDEIV
jgi:hypothetical protein